MMRKGLWILVIVTLFAGLALLANAEEKKANAEEKKGEKKDGDNKDLKIGGHIKMQLFDQSSGTSTVSGVDYDNTDKWGFGSGSHTFILFISKEISDNLSIEIAPDYGLGSAGATPSLGKKIGQQRKSTSSTYGNPTAGNIPSLKLYQQFVKYNLPDQKLELKAGYLNCLFTWDYGKELAWHEEYNFNKASLYLGSWHDSGIEAYRNFELGSVSMPVYLYLLNGSGGTSYTDNNSNKTIMVHAEPEFSGKLAGLKTHVSYGFGAWGDQDYAASYGTYTSTATTLPSKVAASLKNSTYYKWATGVSYDYQKFAVRTEFMGGNWKNKFNFGKSSEEDQGSNGYYLKLFYKIVPEKWTAMLDYSLYQTEKDATTHETYKTTTLGLQHELATAATLILQIDIADWKDDKTPKNELKFNRMTTGIRITF